VGQETHNAGGTDSCLAWPASPRQPSSLTQAWARNLLAWARTLAEPQKLGKVWNAMQKTNECLSKSIGKPETKYVFWDSFKFRY